MNEAFSFPIGFSRIIWLVWLVKSLPLFCFRIYFAPFFIYRLRALQCSPRGPRPEHVIDEYYNFKSWSTYTDEKIN